MRVTAAEGVAKRSEVVCWDKDTCGFEASHLIRPANAGHRQIVKEVQHQERGKFPSANASQDTFLDES